MKKTVFILLTIYITCSAFAQAKFKITVGGPNNDVGRCVRQMKDKWYVAVGTTSPGNADIYILKFDTLGKMLYKKTIGGTGIEQAYWFEETVDSCFIIAGFTNNTGGNGYDVHLTKANKHGDKIWDKTYGGTDWDMGFCVQQTADSGFIIGGTTYSFGKGNADMYLVRTNSNGDTLWTKTYGGIDDDEIKAVKQTSDGGYIITGYTKSFGEPNGDVYILKTTGSGDTLWTRRFGGTQEDIAHDVIESTNTDYIIGGQKDNYGDTSIVAYVIRLDVNGGLVWAKEEGNGLPDRRIVRSLVEDSYGDIALAGSMYREGAFSGWNGLYWKLNSAGAATGQYAFAGDVGTIQDDEFYSIAKTQDKGYILCGYTDTTYAGFGTFPDVFIWKTDSAGNKPGGAFLTNISPIQNSLLQTHAYPNPSSGIITLTCSKPLNENVFIQLADIAGKNCSALIQVTRTSPFSFTLMQNSLQPGVYFVNIIEDNIRIGQVRLAIN